MPPHLHLASTSPAGEPDPGTHDPIRVAIADDHRLMRHSLRLLLDEQDDIEVVAEAHDFATASLALEQQRPGVLVLDLRMPDGSALDLLGALRERSPQTGIVVLTMEENPAFALRALEAGATGFAVKDIADTELPQAVRAAAHGERYVSPRIADRLRSSEPQAQRLHFADGRADAP